MKWGAIQKTNKQQLKSEAVNVANKLAEPKKTETASSDNSSKDLLYDSYQERVAIIQHDANIPAEWAEAFARLEFMQRPAAIRPKKWQAAVNNAGLLLDCHINSILDYKWSVKDIFGVHYKAPERRVDAMGLLLILGDFTVSSVTGDKITMTNSKGTTSSFYKCELSSPQEQVYIWELD